MKKYRVYEVVRNGGGFDSIGTGSEYVEADSPEEAAEEAAEDRRGDPTYEGVVIVATDDNGDSATSDV